MELRIPTLEQLRTVYDRDLRTAFPAAELKPLKNMEEMWAEGRYRPWCLFDGDDIAGEAFLWLGHPGWALQALQVPPQFAFLYFFFLS